MRPWYLHGWGIASLAYLLITGALGVAFLIASRRVPARVPTSDGALRVGAFTALPRSRVGAEQATPAARSDVPLFTDADPALGAPADRAALTIVEFSSFECPFCKLAFPVIREVAATYGDRIRFVYRDFFDDDLHPAARKAAEAAACAHAQGKFWAYHDKLFAVQPAFDLPALARYARGVGLDGPTFDACLASGATAAEVQRDVDAGITLGVRGTPTWFILPGDDSAKARRVEGVIPREAFREFLDRMLSRPGKGK